MREASQRRRLKQTQKEIITQRQRNARHNYISVPLFDHLPTQTMEGSVVRVLQPRPACLPSADVWPCGCSNFKGRAGLFAPLSLSLAGL